MAKCNLKLENRVVLVGLKLSIVISQSWMRVGPSWAKLRSCRYVALHSHERCALKKSPKKYKSEQPRKDKRALREIEL